MGRAVVALTLGLMVACGPSMRMVHQNAEYFERCQAAHYDPDVSDDVRRTCWARWLTHYTEGQPAERVRYARARLAEFEGGSETAPLPGVGRSRTASQRPTYLSSTDAGDGGTAERAPDAEEGASPPDGGSDRAEQGPPEPLPPPPSGRSSACFHLCEPRWEACARRCRGRHKSCLEACESEHRTCMSACH
ncbi:MAG: hypothetical protein ACODAU_10865 [Myxococcota bacterium]